MELNEDKIKEMTLFQVKRKITSIYKNFFFIIEDLSNSGYNVNDETYQKIRKRVLDNANDAIREIEDYFNNLKINLK
jgi:predicted esterase YcpF (UPF0227 family)